MDSYIKYSDIFLYKNIIFYYSNAVTHYALITNWKRTDSQTKTGKKKTHFKEVRFI